MTSSAFIVPCREADVILSKSSHNEHEKLRWPQRRVERTFI